MTHQEIIALEDKVIEATKVMEEITKKVWAERKANAYGVLDHDNYNHYGTLTVNLKSLRTSIDTVLTAMYDNGHKSLPSVLRQ